MASTNNDAKTLMDVMQWCRDMGFAVTSVAVGDVAVDITPPAARPPPGSNLNLAEFDRGLDELRAEQEISDTESEPEEPRPTNAYEAFARKVPMPTIEDTD